MPSDSRLELWGGLECTVARIGDDVRDQILETGHRDRIEDLDRIAALGIRTLRYPAIWETISPDHPDEVEWGWHDARFQRLAELGIRPIAGLCHHGSGPRYTNLLDERFPELLARHAGRVAERYPWIDLYTPVNEPLTTARFAALYGHWYPHQASGDAFLRAVVIECKATALAMRAIRSRIPGAKLVQTDDFGKTFSTASLDYQADYENERRWLSFDLLFGRVDRHHPFWEPLLEAGVPEADLAVLAEGDGAPDIVGINHYLTSERFLDERVDAYPGHLVGSNAWQSYADVEAVRVEHLAGDVGPEARLREVWERYRRPIAVTEAHHGCTRDEQVRWLMEVWKAAETLRGEGADIRAVTIWALFGVVDWNTVLTQRNGAYEPGVFDVRAGEPRPTALASIARSLATEGSFEHPVLDRPGWWKRAPRFYAASACAVPTACARVGGPRRILIADAGEPLGRALARVCEHRGLDHILLSETGHGLARSPAVPDPLADRDVWAVIHTAGHRRGEPDREAVALVRNQDGAAILAASCAQRRIPFVSFSTDLVFDGRLGRACLESDPVAPSSSIGRIAAEAERRIVALDPGALIVRTGPIFGAWDRTNFAQRTLKTLSAGGTPKPGGDVVTPSYAPDLAHAVLDLLIDGEGGIWHLAQIGGVSWHALARDLAERGGFDPALVSDRGLDANPLNTALDTERGVLLRPLGCALGRFFRDNEVDWSMAQTVSAVAAE